MLLFKLRITLSSESFYELGVFWFKKTCLGLKSIFLISRFSQRIWSKDEKTERRAKAWPSLSLSPHCNLCECRCWCWQRTMICLLLFRRHFLFKTGTGTTPLFSTATPGYTMASGSVYSPPTRPLPRNTLSRSAFKFKKSSKYCSWKCTALCAVGVSVLLAVLLSYFIGKNKVLELFWL